MLERENGCTIDSMGRSSLARLAILIQLVESGNEILVHSNILLSFHLNLCIYFIFMYFILINCSYEKHFSFHKVLYFFISLFTYIVVIIL
jgi:hypothetical protein